MRNPERMKPFLEQIKEVWLEFPDWRFSQLICNFIRENGDPFYLEEDEFATRLRKWVKVVKYGVEDDG